MEPAEKLKTLINRTKLMKANA